MVGYLLQNWSNKCNDRIGIGKIRKKIIRGKHNHAQLRSKRDATQWPQLFLYRDQRAQLW